MSAKRTAPSWRTLSVSRSTVPLPTVILSGGRDPVVRRFRSRFGCVAGVRAGGVCDGGLGGSRSRRGLGGRGRRAGPLLETARAARLRGFRRLPLGLARLVRLHGLLRLGFLVLLVLPGLLVALLLLVL